MLLGWPFAFAVTIQKKLKIVLASEGALTKTIKYKQQIYFCLFFKTIDLAFVFCDGFLNDPVLDTVSL